jgi:hypothetical protein
LQDASAELYRGWDRDKKAMRSDRRITIVYGDYVVVVQIQSDPSKATFITAYVAGAETVRKIRSGPRW